MTQTSKDMLERVAKVKARNAILETVPKSGYHENDRDCRGNFCAPQHRFNPIRPDGVSKLPRLSVHIVPFWDTRTVVFVGTCAARALGALRDYYTYLASLADLDTGVDRKLVKAIPDLKLVDVEGVERLTIFKDEWNDYLYALQWMGVGLTGIPMVHDGTTE
jgi:hypothetical protein